MESLGAQLTGESNSYPHMAAILLPGHVPYLGGPLSKYSELQVNHGRKKEPTFSRSCTALLSFWAPGCTDFLACAVAAAAQDDKCRAGRMSYRITILKALSAWFSREIPRNGGPPRNSSPTQGWIVESDKDPTSQN